MGHNKNELIISKLKLNSLFSIKFFIIRDIVIVLVSDKWVCIEFTMIVLFEDDHDLDS